MRLVFMGTPDFAKTCLETLYTDGFDIAAVYTKLTVTVITCCICVIIF